MALGTENVKRLLDAGFGLAFEVANDLKDKKISFFESIGLVDNIFEVVSVAKNLDAFKAEVLDMDVNEALDIDNYVMNKWKVPKEKVKTFIDHAITQAFSLISLVNEFKHLKDPVI